MHQGSSQADLVEHYRLETRFGEASVCHTISSPLTRAHEEEWRRGQVVGRGGFGVVHLEHGPKDRVRAVKVIDKTIFLPGLDFTRELAIMSFLTKHGGSLFVQFLGWFENSENLYIAMEYFEKGDLRRHLGERLSVPTAKLLAEQLLEGLSFMHRSGIAHRDLKPENIFVVSLSPLRVKLGDFGVSKCNNEDTMLRTRIFTRSYSAPEILGVLDSSEETSEYTRAVDIWSLGCVMFEVLTGSVLFRTEGFVWPFCHGKAECMLEPLREAVGGEDGFEFVRRLVSPDPVGRPDAVDALRDPWLKVPRTREVKEGGDTLAHVMDAWPLGFVFETLAGNGLFGTECFVRHPCYGKAELVLEPLREAVGEEGGPESARRLLLPDPERLSTMEALGDPWSNVPMIKSVKEGGDLFAHVLVRPQIRVRELLPPISPGVSPHIFRFNEILENPLAQYPEPGNSDGIGGQESTIHGTKDGAGWHGFPYAILTRRRNINGALTKPPLPLPDGSKDLLGFFLKELLALASVLSIRLRCHQDHSGGASSDVDLQATASPADSRDGGKERRFEIC